jgi:hypothetical protein
MSWLRRRAKPSTLIGRYFVAGVLRRHDQRASLRAELDRSGWVHADKVASVVFEAVVRGVCSPNVTTVPVPDMVAAMRTFYGADGIDRVPQDAAELLVRAALGEDVDLSQIPDEVSFSARSLIFAGLATDLELDEHALNWLLVRAESEVKAGGFEPTLAN